MRTLFLLVCTIVLIAGDECAAQVKTLGKLGELILPGFHIAAAAYESDPPAFLKDKTSALFDFDAGYRHIADSYQGYWFVFETHEAIAVGFRGTDSLRDVGMDISVRGTAELGGESYHSGFAARMSLLPLAFLVRAANVTGKYLFFAGHSAGGAIAGVAATNAYSLAAEYGAKITAYAVGFGAPYFATNELVPKDVKDYYVNVVLEGDPVPLSTNNALVPYIGASYTLVGKAIELASDGSCAVVSSLSPPAVSNSNHHKTGMYQKALARSSIATSHVPKLWRAVPPSPPFDRVLVTNVSATVTYNALQLSVDGVNLDLVDLGSWRFASSCGAVSGAALRVVQRGASHLVLAYQGYDWGYYLTGAKLTLRAFESDYGGECTLQGFTVSAIAASVTSPVVPAARIVNSKDPHGFRQVDLVLTFILCIFGGVLLYGKLPRRVVPRRDDPFDVIVMLDTTGDIDGELAREARIRNITEMVTHAQRGADRLYVGTYGPRPAEAIEATPAPLLSGRNRVGQIEPAVRGALAGLVNAAEDYTSRGPNQPRQGELRGLGEAFRTALATSKLDRPATDAPTASRLQRLRATIVRLYHRVRAFIERRGAGATPLRRRLVLVFLHGDDAGGTTVAQHHERLKGLVGNYNAAVMIVTMEPAKNIVDLSRHLVNCVSIEDADLLGGHAPETFRAAFDEWRQTYM